MQDGFIFDLGGLFYEKVANHDLLNAVVFIIFCIFGLESRRWFPTLLKNMRKSNMKPWPPAHLVYTGELSKMGFGKSPTNRDETKHFWNQPIVIKHVVAVFAAFAVVVVVVAAANLSDHHT